MSHPLLKVPRAVYEDLMANLARSGRGIKEAGAFLLGKQRDGVREVQSYLLYDQVAVESSRNHDYVVFTAEEMGRAWDHCYRLGLEVIADVHTHPAGCAQSATDKAHPMVAIAGHVALIVPWFALKDTLPFALGVHVFLGNGRWLSHFGGEAASAIELI
jgi:proteasome lid subunit RPN8/RPN11